MNMCQDTEGNENINSTTLGKGANALRHERLAHMSPLIVGEIIRSGNYGMNRMDRGHKHKCSTCAQMKKKIFPSKGDSVEHVENITVHADSRSWIPSTKYGWMRYFLTLTMTPWQYVTVHLLEMRTEISKYHFILIALFEQSSRHKAKSFHSDNSAQFLALRTQLNYTGVEKTTSLAYKPLSNGVAEFINRTLLMKVRETLRQAGIKQRFLGDAILTAEYVQNRIGKPLLKKKTAMGMLLNKRPENLQIEVFGCASYIHMRKETQKNKLDDHAERGMFLGSREKIYRICNLLKKKATNTKMQCLMRWISEVKNGILNLLNIAGGNVNVNLFTKTLDPTQLNLSTKRQIWIRLLWVRCGVCNHLWKARKVGVKQVREKVRRA